MMAESKAKKPAAKDAAVNMRGLKCPLPTLKTRKLLSKMASGGMKGLMRQMGAAMKGLPPGGMPMR